MSLAEHLGPEPEEPSNSSDVRSDSLPEAMAIDEFEGEYVRIMRGKIPAIALDMDEGYRRGTHLRVQMDLRVRHVHYDEATAKHQRGELVRVHQFTIEEVAAMGVLSEAQADPGVGGSASGRLNEVDAFGAVARECFYQYGADEEPQLVHRGACDRCSHRMVASDPGF